MMNIMNEKLMGCQRALCNEGGGEKEGEVGAAISLTNETREGGEGHVAPEWIEIPYGNHDHREGMQVCDEEACKLMAANFAETKESKGKKYKGIPIYLGHPDDAKAAGAGGDKRARGWIRMMELGNEGLRLKTDWTALGRKEVEDEEVAYFSPRWAVRRMANTTRNYRPVRLMSVGLVNDPNIEGILPLTNEAEESKDEGKWDAPPWVHELAGTDAEKDGEEEVRKALTGKVAAAQQIGEVLRKLQDALPGPEGEKGGDGKLANERERAERAEAAAARERRGRAELAVEKLITSGRIAIAEKNGTLEMLTNAGDSFDQVERKLSNQAPVMGVGECRTRNLGSRRAEADAAQAGEGNRQAKVIELVNERMTRTGESYQSAWTNARREYPALFDEMKHPIQRGKTAKAR